MRKFAAALIILVAGGTVVPAHSQETSNEISGTVGHTFVSDQTPPNTNFFDNTVHFGSALSFEFNYARNLRNYRWGTLSAEIPVVFNLDEDLNYGLNQVPRDYKSIFITPAARVTFLHDFPFSPWVSFGAGIGHFQAGKNLVFFGTNTGHRVKTTGVLQGGLGMDVKLPKLEHTRFRFEARDDWSGVPPINVNTGKTRQHNYYVGGGLVFYF
jgi:hypothetical protein